MLEYPYLTTMINSHLMKNRSDYLVIRQACSAVLFLRIIKRTTSLLVSGTHLAWIMVAKTFPFLLVCFCVKFHRKARSVCIKLSITTKIIRKRSDLFKRKHYLHCCACGLSSLWNFVCYHSFFVVCLVLVDIFLKSSPEVQAYIPNPNCLWLWP